MSRDLSKSTMDGIPLESRLLSLPNEILRKIMTFAVTSNVPFHLRLFVEMARDPDKFTDGKKRNVKVDNLKVLSMISPTDFVAPGRTTASPLSEAWWLQVLPRSQIEHYRDWIFMNSTCHQMRAWGCHIFFREKIFIIDPDDHDQLRGSGIPGMNPIISSLIKENVSNVALPIRGMIPRPWINIPKIHQAFNNLHTLNVYVPAISKEVYEWTAERFTVVPPPQELQQMFRSLGPRLFDHLVFNIMIVEPRGPMVRDNSGLTKQDFLRDLETVVYPILRVLVSRGPSNGV